MWRTLEIDLVAPPYAGHLFPLLDLAGGLRRLGVTGLRVLSTADAAAAVRLCQLPSVTLLPGREKTVQSIAGTRERVGFHPLRLYRQFAMNLTLMIELRDQLLQLWTARRPDVVIADFTIPVAGLVARRLGIPWWTSLPSPCALETRTGTPSYLGGWSPPTGPLGRWRDALGRRLIRLFKQSVAALFARQLRELGFPGVYRADDTETIYSDECILGLGMRELEFERDWPASFRFIGPLVGTPPFPHTPPEFEPGRRHVLITLGTHLPWARQGAEKLMAAVARALPECVFHFALGRPGSQERVVRANLHYHGFIPYEQYLHRYAAVVTHGGTGSMYACVKAGVPMLVWPHDFDQFDHAARIVARGLGVRLQPSVPRVTAALCRLMTDETLRQRVRAFQRLSQGYDPHRQVFDALARLKSTAAR